MKDIITNQLIIRKATEIVMKLRETNYVHYSDTDGFRGWVARAVALVFAYHYGYEEYDNEEEFFNDWLINYDGKKDDVNYWRAIIGRVRYVFEYYNFKYDDVNLWTLTAYLWQNDIGEEYAMSIYERDCLDDSYYVEMGSIIKNVLL